MYDEEGAEYIDCINNVAHGRYQISGWWGQNTKAVNLAQGLS